MFKLHQITNNLLGNLVANVLLSFPLYVDSRSIMLFPSVPQRTTTTLDNLM